MKIEWQEPNIWSTQAIVCNGLISLRVFYVEKPKTGFQIIIEGLLKTKIILQEIYPTFAEGKGAAEYWLETKLKEWQKEDESLTANSFENRTVSDWR